MVQDGRLVDLEEVEKNPSPQLNRGDPSGEKNNNDGDGKENPTA